MATNKGMAGLDFALGMRSEFDRALGATIKVEKSFEAMRSIQDTIWPASLRAVVDAQRSVRHMIDPFGIGPQRDLLRRSKEMDGLLGFGARGDSFRKASELAEPWGLRAQASLHAGVLDRDRLGFADSMRKVFDVMNVHHGLFAASTVTDLTTRLRDLIGPAFPSERMEPFRKLDSALAGILPSGIRDRWQDHLAKSMLPSLGLLGMAWDRPVGVLAPMAEPHLGASLTWLRPSVRPSAAVAALITEQARLPEITIEATITCAFCDSPMIDHECSFRWKGNRKGAINISVIPVCTTCTRRSMEDPQYVSNALRRLTSPRLRIVKGGTTDGVARGRLHLVKDDDEK